jgi:hypothetical protein
VAELSALDHAEFRLPIGAFIAVSMRFSLACRGN